MCINHRSGFSVVETLVALGIMSIGMLIFVMMMTNQQKENIAVQEKLALLSIERDVLTFSANDICGKEFLRVPASYTFAPSAINSSLEIELLKMYQSSSADQILYEKDSNISTGGLKISKMYFKNLNLVGPNKYSADFFIESDGGLRSYRPLDFKMLITTKTVSGQIVLDGCSGFKGQLELANVGCATGLFLERFDNQGIPVCKAPPAAVNTVVNNNPTEPEACPSYWETMGTFSCAEEQEYQSICGCLPPGYADKTLWTNQGAGCYSHRTGKLCVCATDWTTMGTFTCNAGAESQTICGCRPPGHDDPLLWNFDGVRCYSHRTGKTCT